MKSIIKILSIACLGAMVSCEDIYDDLNLNEANNQVIYTSEMDFGNRIQVNGTITFGDVSSGVQSRQWSFPEGAVDIIGSDNDTSSTENTVKTVFTSPGEHKVRLQQTYNGNAYVGTDQRGSDLDTTLTITVLDSVALQVQAYLLNPDGSLGEELTLSDNAENEVMAGSFVRYIVSPTGEPSDYVWNTDGGDPGTSEEFVNEFDVRYKKLGTFGFGLYASRERPAGESLVEVENFLKIIPSTEPVILEGAFDANGKISLNFSREMNANTLNPADFIVSIAHDGTDIPATVAAATVDPEEANLVILSLENELIYNDDQVLISYQQGEMATTDGMPADSFSDLPVVFIGTNILENTAFDYSFENSTVDNWPYQWWGAPWDKYQLAISNHQAFDGNNSAAITLEPHGGMIISNADSDNNLITFPAEAGKTYEMGVWVYVEDLGNTPEGAVPPDLRFYWSPNTNWGVGANPAFDAAFPVGEWVYSSVLVEFPASGDYSLNIRGANENNTAPLSIFMDNISLSEARLRP
ncbi:hypothetical protein DN752_04915 [Echinicola strongylocentroti]|uniref:PKD domain-containing protein n=1 Tax=Echinicola strongylocentroti TaxID=1795355 RepID=A0A2Z4IGE4_9BACT|nr:hypothetical protein [Echinicola strongylocentroti]AWW29523.1 hypothetical protein DN752_04915 [Echinicola strongylocentroti]